MLLAPTERMFIPLDTKVFDDSHKQLIDDTAMFVGGYKIGLTAFFNPMPNDRRISVGSAAISYLLNFHPSKKRFIDGKFKDIPDQVGGAAYGVGQAGHWGFTIHADNTPAAIEAAVRNRADALVIGVTVLTSYDPLDCEETYGKLPADAVLLFARRLQKCGGQAIVCSPQELGPLSRIGISSSLTVITPGIRDAGSPVDDQKRTATIFEAARDGADYYVVGRLLTRAANKIEAAQRLCDDIDRGIAARTF